MNTTKAIIDEMRAYAWPTRLAGSLHTREGGFHIDFKAVLSQVPAATGADDILVFSVLTETYLPIFDRWLALARNSGLKRFIIGYIGVDAIGEHLRRCGVSFFRIDLPESFLVETSFHNKGGFSATGAAAIYSRTLVAERLVSAGHDLLCCDVDAWLLRRPTHLEASEADISFQRVVYFPTFVVDQWGFALCGGFVFYRATTRTSAWLQEICGLMGEVSSDQLALNFAMLRERVTWNTDVARRTSARSEKEAAFQYNAAQPIEGELATGRLSLLALPATIYWRHAFIAPDRRHCILMHPNSSKDAEEKLRTLERWSQDIC